MSIVVPRPHAPSTRAGGRLFSEVVSSYASRHRVKPGITGWAQVHGWRGETHTEDQLLHRLEHDLYYVERSEEHTSELQSLMRISYAVFCLKKKKQPTQSQPMIHKKYI